MIKVFIGNKLLTFQSKGAQPIRGQIFYHSSPEIEQLMKDFASEKVHSGCFSGKDWEMAFAQFSRQFKILEAAGGIVYNDKNQILFIYRLGKWDLPKGKIEDGESPLRAAEREVCEETGVCEIKTKPLLPFITYHTYLHREEHYLKKTYWYTMSSLQTHLLKPQVEENITAVKWLTKPEAKKALANTYASIQDMLTPLL